MKGLVFWTLFLPLIQLSFQEEDAKCSRGCVDGYCDSICHYVDTPEYVLCSCKQYVIGGEVTCNEGSVGVECESTVQPADSLSEESCKEFCEGNGEECKAYVFSKEAGVSQCTLLRKCSKDAPDQNPPNLINAKQRCVACSKLEFTYGLTAIHYICDLDSLLDTNPYVNTMPTGTRCHPTNSCTDPTISIEDKITCTQNGDTAEGTWTNGNGDPVLDLKTDVQCKCSSMRVAVQSGTKVSCETPVDPNEGFYTLDAFNVCVLLCDGAFIMKMSCQFEEEANEETKTAWMGEWHDGYVQKLPECLECFSPGGCPSGHIDGFMTFFKY